MAKISIIYIGADHAGFKVKERIKKYFKENNLKYLDVGVHSLKCSDYPDYALKVARKVSKDVLSKGILICGTGTGMVIAANKVEGIRAVAAYDGYTARMSRLHNDANILGLRGRDFPCKKILEIISIWLKTPFSYEPRHKRRIDKIKKIEKRL